MFRREDRWTGLKPPHTFWERRALGAATPTRQAFWKGMAFGAEGSLVGLPMIALEAGIAQRGEVLPTIAARSAGLVTYPAMTGLIAAALSIPAGPFRGIGFIAGMLGMYPDTLVQDGILRGFRAVSDAGRAIRHIETGGTYQDTELAQQQRMLAINEMSGAMATSRRYLGQEAQIFHR